MMSRGVVNLHHLGHPFFLACLPWILMLLPVTGVEKTWHSLKLDRDSFENNRGRFYGGRYLSFCLNILSSAANISMDRQFPKIS
jgi:hypothetical protein